MKFIKYIMIGLVGSIFMVGIGVDASTYVEYSVINIDVPGLTMVATVSGEEFALDGNQYAQTTNTIDKINQGLRSTSARVQAMYDPVGFSSWVEIPNGAGYKNLGNLDTNYYKLQLKENTWSALGFYWFGKWKLPR